MGSTTGHPNNKRPPIKGQCNKCRKKVVLRKFCGKKEKQITPKKNRKKTTDEHEPIELIEPRQQIRQMKKKTQIKTKMNAKETLFKFNSDIIRKLKENTEPNCGISTNYKIF